nr:hypothetical protein [Mycobacterium sp. UM_NZ2]
MPLTPEQQAQLLADGDAAYEQSLRPDDGQPVDPATVSMPNFQYLRNRKEEGTQP